MNVITMQKGKKMSTKMVQIPFSWKTHQELGQDQEGFAVLSRRGGVQILLMKLTQMMIQMTKYNQNILVQKTSKISRFEALQELEQNPEAKEGLALLTRTLEVKTFGVMLYRK